VQNVTILNGHQHNIQYDNPNCGRMVLDLTYPYTSFMSGLLFSIEFQVPTGTPLKKEY
jgi:hypothetical protein